MLEIKEVTYDQVAGWKKAAAEERSSISDTKNTTWWKVYEDGVECGCAGLMVLSGNGYRIKGVYVTPKRRGTGVGTWLTELLLEKAEDECCAAWLEAFALNTKFYLERGFKVVGRNAHGVEYVKKWL